MQKLNKTWDISRSIIIQKKNNLYGWHRSTIFCENWRIKNKGASSELSTDIIKKWKWAFYGDKETRKKKCVWGPSWKLKNDHFSQKYHSLPKHFSEGQFLKNYKTEKTFELVDVIFEKYIIEVAVVPYVLFLTPIRGGGNITNGPPCVW